MCVRECVCLFVCPSVCLSVCLSVCPSVCQNIYSHRFALLQAKTNSPATHTGSHAIKYLPKKKLARVYVAISIYFLAKSSQFSRNHAGIAPLQCYREAAPPESLELVAIGVSIFIYRL